MTHRGPFQPLPFCDSLNRDVKKREKFGEAGVYMPIGFRISLYMY